MAEQPEPTSRMESISAWFLADDVITAAEYYRDKLGFWFDNFFGNPLSFVIVSRDAVDIALTQADLAAHGNTSNTKLVPGTYDAYIRVSDIAALESELLKRGANVVQGPVDRIYGMRELIVHDCNGYVLCFGQALAE